MYCEKHNMYSKSYMLRNAFGLDKNQAVAFMTAIRCFAQQSYNEFHSREMTFISLDTAFPLPHLTFRIENMLLIQEEDFDIRDAPRPPMDVAGFYDSLETKRMARLHGLVQQYNSIESLLIKVRSFPVSFASRGSQQSPHTCIVFTINVLMS